MSLLGRMTFHNSSSLAELVNFLFSHWEIQQKYLHMGNLDQESYVRSHSGSSTLVCPRPPTTCYRRPRGFLPGSSTHGRLPRVILGSGPPPRALPMAPSLGTPLGGERPRQRSSSPSVHEVGLTWQSMALDLPGSSAQWRGAPVVTHSRHAGGQARQQCNPM